MTELFTGFGRLRAPAERVAEEAIRPCERYPRSTAPVGESLADQLLLPLALVGSGVFATVAITEHTRTHADLLKQFCDCRIATEQRGRDGFRVVVG